jgi:hypothetical protein
VAGLNDCALTIKDCQPNDDVLVRALSPEARPLFKAPCKDGSSFRADFFKFGVKLSNDAAQVAQKRKLADQRPKRTV